MHIVGIPCGSLNGNSKILLEAAVQAALASGPNISATIIQLNEVSCLSYPLLGSFDLGLGAPFGSLRSYCRVTRSQMTVQLRWTTSLTLTR
jgi:hypothetical protein